MAVGMGVGVGSSDASRRERSAVNMVQPTIQRATTSRTMACTGLLFMADTFGA
jgi:hypothetical protein